jgi:hypothetical protein
MSSAEMHYFTMMFLALVFTLGVITLFYFTTLKNYLSGKMFFLAFCLSPFVLVILFMLIIQIDAVGFQGLLSGDFNCSSLHGGGSHRCGIFGALFDSVINTVVFSLISFGLYPVAACALTLLLLALMSKTIRKS